jgi:hypothetical protein
VRGRGRREQRVRHQRHHARRQTVQSDGALPTPAETPIPVDGDTVTVSIPAGTARLLTFSG